MRRSNAGEERIHLIHPSTLELKFNERLGRCVGRQKDRLGRITCLRAAEQAGHKGNYFTGANIAGFIKVANAMMDHGDT